VRVKLLDRKREFEYNIEIADGRWYNDWRSGEKDSRHAF